MTVLLYNVTEVIHSVTIFGWFSLDEAADISVVNDGIGKSTNQHCLYIQHVNLSVSHDLCIMLMEIVGIRQRVGTSEE